MIINVKSSTMVRPAEEMPKRSLRLSNWDLLNPSFHTPCVYFYRPNGSPDFFDPNPIKEALSKALVLFYPIAGRLSKDPYGRVEIDCNGEGVLFVEAETTSVLDDLDHFSSVFDFKTLIPAVDYSDATPSYPLWVIQLTYFECGGVSLGARMHHFVGDCYSNTYFINTWAEIARGVEPTLLPIHDRSTILRARDPPQPKFDHIEYRLSSTPTRSTVVQDLDARLFNLTIDQINALKAKTDIINNNIRYTTNDIVSGHIWRCACLARGVGGAQDQQVSTLSIAVDARSRLHPNLPKGYFGNTNISRIAAARELVCKPTWFAASRVHEAVTRMDDDYLRSALDYLELEGQAYLDELRSSNLSPNNFVITSWRWMQVYRSDFGWGPPVFVGPPMVQAERVAIILPRPVNDGSILFLIILQPQHMKLFETYLYDI